MAKSGGVSGILGTHSEPPAEGLAAEVPTTLDATAAALAAEIAKSNPELAQKAAAYFDKQSRLVEAQGQLVRIQTEHLHEQRAVNLQLLKLKRFGERLRVGLQIFVILVATVIGVFGAVLIHDAVTSRRVVIEPFRSPAALAARGADGSVVAAQLLDELTRLQNATHSTATALGLSGAWSDNIKLDVPEVGVSIGELSRLLRERFGHDVHIDGDLIETPTGELALTVRGKEVPPKRFSGPVGGLDKLTVAAAEYVYSKSQPARWAAYLLGQSRFAETIAFCRAAVASAEPGERPALLSRWALAVDNTGGSTREALGLYRAAIKLKPDDWTARLNSQNDMMILGDEEGAWRSGEEQRAVAGGRPGRSTELAYANWDYLTWNLQAWLAAQVADADAEAGIGSGQASSGPQIADIDVRLHDPEAAQLALKTTTEDPNDVAGAALVHHVRARLAWEAGDMATAVAEVEAFGAAYLTPSVAANNPGYQCLIAPIEEAGGHPDRADAVLKSVITYVDCYRFRADILDGRGDWPGAQKAYADAVDLAPDLPAAYYSWGIALARHGDLAGGEVELKEANKRGPHWADPLKAWGDVLLKQGNRQEALAKYDDALKYAPNWKQLKEAREAAAKPKS
jgi:tetratricopeptide (TPR) repeat protein